MADKCISDHHYQDDWMNWVDQPLQGTYIVLPADTLFENANAYYRFPILDDAIREAKRASKRLNTKVHILMDCGYIDESIKII